MKIAAWNCQGAGNEEFCTNAMELYRMHRSHILILAEPKISGDTVYQVIRQLPYVHSHRVDPNGFSCGIWLLWNEACFSIEFLTNYDQSIHALVNVQSTTTFILTVLNGQNLLNSIFRKNIR